MKVSNKTKRFLALFIALGIVVGSWAVWYVFFKPHRDVSKEEPAFTLTAEALNKAFKEDTSAIATYIDKAILIEGVVSEIGESYIAFGNIVCNFDETTPLREGQATLGQKLVIQGRVSTYNDLMEEIIVDKCVIK